ncbi:MAG: CAP domain-containing protein [Acidimicrobiales bacterium]
MRATEHHLHEADRRGNRRDRRGPHRHGAAARRTGGLAALAIAALLALGAPAAVPVAEAAPLAAPAVATVVSIAAVAGPTDVAPDEQVFVADANAARAARGLPPLSVDGQLTASARRWSSSMAAAGTISHDQNLAAGAGQPWTTLGENVGTGPSASPVSAALLASPGHYANIVNGAFTKVGVGVVWTKDRLGRDVLWVTERFLGYSPTVTTSPAAPSTPSAPSPAAPATTTPPPVASPAAPTATAPVTTPTTAPPATTPTTAAPTAADPAPATVPTDPSASTGESTSASRLHLDATPDPAAVTGSGSPEAVPAAVTWTDASFAASLTGSATALALFAALVLVGWGLAVWRRPVEALDVASLPPAPSSAAPRSAAR